MTRRAPRSTFQRAVLPVLGGIGFLALLALATWGIAAVLSDNPDRVNEALAATTFEPGNSTTLAAIVAESGPLIFPDLVRAGGTRTIVLDHTGDDPRLRWTLHYAHPADRPVECKVTQVRETRQFTDCEGRTIEVADLAPPQAGVKLIVGETVTVDFTGAIATTTTGSTTGSTTSGTDAGPATSEAP